MPFQVSAVRIVAAAEEHLDDVTGLHASDGPSRSSSAAARPLRVGIVFTSRQAGAGRRRGRDVGSPRVEVTGSFTQTTLDAPRADVAREPGSEFARCASIRAGGRPSVKNTCFCRVACAPEKHTTSIKRDAR